MLKLIFSYLSAIKDLSSSLNILTDTRNTKPKIVFFSEDKVYQKFSKLLIETILLIYKDEIFYISFDKEDKINNYRVRNYYVNPIFINYIFNNLKAKNLFLTITDLDNNLLRKTKNIDNYIYYFHSPVSTTKNYTSEAFDNYDVIMCLGQFQIDEIRAREKFKNIKKKKLIPTGYFYFDYLTKIINKNFNYKEILIAPSWNKNMKNSINENFIDLIHVLIEKGYYVNFRPHPEHFKRSKYILDKMKILFSSYNFKLDNNVDNIKSMEQAKCLITDSSGIAIEYMIIMKRPVLYLDEYDKIHNSEFKDYSNLTTIDFKIKHKFGYLFKKNDFCKIDDIINESEKIFLKKTPELIKFINENYFNFGKTQKYLLSNYKKKI